MARFYFHKHDTGLVVRDPYGVELNTLSDAVARADQLVERVRLYETRSGPSRAFSIEVSDAAGAVVYVSRLYPAD